MQVKIVEGKEFRYQDFGSETHGRSSFRLWISKKYPTPPEGLNFPISGDLKVTDKGTNILIPSSEKVVYDIFVRCGFRGESRFEILSPEEVKMLKYFIYSSPRGNIGVSAGALVVADKATPLKIKWKKTGRLYGSPASGISVYYPDGKVEKISKALNY